MNGIMLLERIAQGLGLLVSLCFLYQFVYLFIPFFKKPRPHRAEKLHRYGVLIAARNEEAVLPYLLDSIRSQDYPAELLTVCVVADNCTDRTAEAAARGGAVVYRRFDRERVGKGYALAYLLEQLDRDMGLDSFDAFLVFDADNLLCPDYITRINRLCADGYDAFCGYRNSKNFGDNWLSACHGLQFLHESAHLNRSRMLLGASCIVSGTGFGFTREVLRRSGGWQFRTLSEDTEFSLFCITQGLRIGYCHDAVFYDEQPTSLRQSWRQRTRWSQGTVQVSLKYAAPLFQNLFRGGMRAYSCFEFLTRSLWGYGLAALSGAVSLAVTFLKGGWWGVLEALPGALTGAYGTLFLIGLMTLLPQWGRICAAAKAKLIGLFLFPVYMVSFVPIILTSLFRKFHWPPITHSAAVTAESLKMSQKVRQKVR